MKACDVTGQWSVMGCLPHGGMGSWDYDAFYRAKPANRFEEFNSNGPARQPNQCFDLGNFFASNAPTGLRAARGRALFRLPGASHVSSQPGKNRTFQGIDRTLKTTLIFILVAAAFYLGMPYYFAYKRRQELKEEEKSRGDDE
jgi:hypothetical protein